MVVGWVERRSGHVRGAGHAGTCSSQGVPKLGHLDLAGGLMSGAALAPGPGVASSGPAGAGRGHAGSPCATLSARGRPLSLRPRWPSAWGAWRRVRARRYLGRGWAPPQPGGRRVAPRCSPGSRSRGGPRAACRAPLPPPSGPAQWNRLRISPPGRARARARGAYGGSAASPPLPRVYETTWTAPSAQERRGEGAGRL